MRIPLLLLVFFTNMVSGVIAAEQWKPMEVPIATRWSEEINPEKVLPEYPRPQMVRAEWKNLNGLWDFTITPRVACCPKEFGDRILVPFPVESSLSGVQKPVTAKDRLWYRQTFTVPTEWKRKRLLLHFGAVDWEARVYVNGQEVGGHTGGYAPFSFDITDYLKSEGDQELVVSVWDPSSDGGQPVGKQPRDFDDIWYTPVSGIWQTVWLEPVAPRSIVSYELVPDIDAQTLTVETLVRGDKKDCVVKVTALMDGKAIATAEANPSEPAVLKIDNPRLWSPDDPFLYDLAVKLLHKEKDAEPELLDAVKGYFGMRKISLGKDEQGIQRLCLNNKPLFQFGLLDQGWWPDGLHTPPCDEALIYDIEITKNLGMNMIRKHVKVEPARWYYHCDRLGMLVWQDMPNKSWNLPKSNGHFDFRKELIEMIENLQTFPSIVMWVPYNESWGQYKTEQVTALIKVLDPTRLVNNASGGTDKKVGDIYDIHVYPDPKMPDVEENRAAVIGEFGGLGLLVDGHLWQREKSEGYRTYEDQAVLDDALNEMVVKLVPMVKKGLAAAVYTQTSDVKIEVNGIMTYDRKVIKVDVERLRKNIEKLYQ